MEDLGIRIKRLRADRGMTQQDLAHEAGLALRTVARLEANEGAPYLPTLDAIARALGMTVSELLNNGDPVGRAS